MEWYEYLTDADTYEIKLYGEDRLMRINYIKNGYRGEAVVSLDTYRVISNVFAPANGEGSIGGLYSLPIVE